MAFDDLLQDLRYTARTLRRDAGFTTFAVLIAAFIVKKLPLYAVKWLVVVVVVYTAVAMLLSAAREKTRNG